MSVTIVPMAAPALLEDVLRVMGKPNRVHLTGSYEEAAEAAAAKIRKEQGFTPDHVRVGLDVSADSMTAEQILALYRRDHAEFKARWARARAARKQSTLSVKELVWFKNEVKDGVIQGNESHYYLSFDRYRFSGKIDGGREPELVQKILEVMEKHGIRFSINLA